MRKTLFLATALPLVLMGMLFAEPQNASDNNSNGKDESTTRGCLRATRRGFQLKSDSGTTYVLFGETSGLSNLAGKEVEIKGERGSATDVSIGEPDHSGITTSNPTAGAAPVIKVASAKEISDQCRK